MPVIGVLTARLDNRWLIALGFALFGISSLWFGQVNLGISQWSFVWAIIISGFGSGCIFVPLSTTAMAGLPNEEIGNASGLYNLMRNIGGSVGISIVNTIVARHEQLHRNELVHSIAPTSVAFEAHVTSLRHYLESQGVPAGDALQKAYGLVNAQLLQQSRLWAYVDDFRYMALVCFLCIPIVFLLKKTVGKGGLSAGH
jgi:DHA2 family multidrug resistance protein